LYALDHFLGLMPYGALQLLGFSFASVFILALGFYGYRQGNLFASRPIALDLDRAAATNMRADALESQGTQFVHRLLDHMSEKKPHLDAELTLGKLSDSMKVSPEYLSGILNGRLNKNFFDFVNHYRIEAFKEMCRQPESQNLKIISLAYDCGFNSKATFNRVFKKATGLTPSEYAGQVSGK
jgi:AraC-like DNA-binding protein